MSQRYVRISMFPENLYLDCSPVLISAGALLKDNKTGKVLVQLKFKNLSENIITAVKVSVSAYDISGIELTGVEEYQYLDVSIKPTESFGDDRAIILPDVNTRNCSIVIKEVVFASTVPWNNKGAITCEPIPEQVPLQNVFNNAGLFEQYKRDTTDHSLYRPAKHLDLWLCSCGTANKRNSQKCSNCKIGLSDLLEATNLDRLAKNYQAYQIQKKKAEDEKARAAKKTCVIISISVACVMLLVVLFMLMANLNTNVLIPRKDYRAAVELMEKGEYLKSITAFEALDGYKDSADRIEQCYVNIYGKERWEAFQDIKIGDTCILGSYEQDNNIANGKECIEWIVIDRDYTKIMIISKYALECLEYHSIYENITWEKASLRKWLNRDFLNTAFSKEEREWILETTVTADENPSYDVFSGFETQDKVFLLSILEANTYFSSNSERECKPTAYAEAKGAMVASVNGNCAWWLRTPGDYPDDASYVNYIGDVCEDGYSIGNKERVVRPAMWIGIE